MSRSWRVPSGEHAEQRFEAPFSYRRELLPGLSPSSLAKRTFVLIAGLVAVGAAVVYIWALSAKVDPVAKLHEWRDRISLSWNKTAAANAEEVSVQKVQADSTRPKRAPIKTTRPAGKTSR